MSNRVKSLEASIIQFSKLRDDTLAEIRELQKKSDGYKGVMDEMVEELSVIKHNWNVLIKSSDPLSKTRLMFRRSIRKCPICGELVFSKKMLKVHKFQKHCY